MLWSVTSLTSFAPSIRQEANKWRKLQNSLTFFFQWKRNTIRVRLYLYGYETCSRTLCFNWGPRQKGLWGNGGIAPRILDLGGLRHVLSSATRTLGSRVRILLGAWMCVRVFLCYVVLYVGRDLASSRSPVQGVLLTVQYIHKFQKNKFGNRKRPRGLNLERRRRRRRRWRR
jgi:hypothetical protein